METLEEAEGLVVDEEKEEGRRTTRSKRKSILDGEDEGRVTDEHKDVLVRRWKQIRDVVNAAIRELGG
jgi:hypothetical protein